MTRFFYRSFGLQIKSDLELSELDLGFAHQDVDLWVRLGPTLAASIDLSEEAQVRLTSAGAEMDFPGVAHFRLDPHGGTIDVHPSAGSERLAALPLLGPVLAFWLHLRGELVLHASALAWDGAVYAFVGDKGAGKSTTAAALLAQGAALVTDDLLRLVASAGEAPLCEPAFAQVKLTAAAAELFTPAGGQAVASPHPLFAKQRWRLDQPRPPLLPLRAICTLARGTRLALTPLEAGEALRTCLDQVFVRRYGQVALADGAAERQFRAVAELVKLVRVVQLTVPDSLVGLGDQSSRLRQLLSEGV